MLSDLAGLRMERRHRQVHAGAERLRLSARRFVISSPESTGDLLLPVVRQLPQQSHLGREGIDVSCRGARERDTGRRADGSLKALCYTNNRLALLTLGG